MVYFVSVSVLSYVLGDDPNDNDDAAIKFTEDVFFCVYLYFF